MTLLLTYDPIGDLSQIPRPLSPGRSPRVWVIDGRLVSLTSFHATLRVGANDTWAVCVEDPSFRCTIKRMFIREQAVDAVARLNRVFEAVSIMCGGLHV